jgi:hypothetical protein
MNTEEFKWGVNWQQVLKSLIEDHQDVEDEEAKQVEIWCLSFHSSKLPVSTKPECYKHGYILNAES